jgi:hypothetical protein
MRRRGWGLVLMLGFSGCGSKAGPAARAASAPLASASPAQSDAPVVAASPIESATPEAEGPCEHPETCQLECPAGEQMELRTFPLTMALCVEGPYNQSAAGPFVGWWANGHKRWQGIDMPAHSKHGRYREWNEQGVLIADCEYDHGRVLAATAPIPITACPTD